jgi:hypothetical protein
MRLFLACTAFALSTLFYAWLVVGMGQAFYFSGFDTAVREILGTRAKINWLSIGIAVALFTAGTVFLCVGVSMLNRRTDHE